jgi:valyl-tRNA synthetase
MLEKSFQPAEIESRHYRAWEQSGAFAAKPDSNAKPHVIMMPPPNVTGSLHIGHALTMTLQDTLTRYHRMKGDDALWLPGTDHAGIATQLIVERQLREQGKTRTDFSRDEFISKVWEWKAQSGGAILGQLRRLGATCDWSREAFTMDEDLSVAVRRVFVTLFREGLIYRAKRLVNWDPKMHTALSDLEVAQKEAKGHMWYIRYPIEGDVERFITIATTRPETMLGDTAIIVHPDDERYQDLIGKFAVLPIVGRMIPIIADTYVEKEFGTGAMKVTPGHDFNDYQIGVRHKLPLINVFDKNAAINENGPSAYRGMDRFDARKKILEELEAQDLLVKTDAITHMVPYDEKTKTVVLEPWLTDQWFVDAETLAKPAIAAVEDGRIELFPKHAENTYFEWLRNIQPWCISRQIWWGHQIPAWHGPDGQYFVAETETEAQEQADKHYGEKRQLTRDPDVLDTWFSSALWPFSTLGWPNETPDLKKYYPGDVLVTGFDIIFFWVARMIMMGMHFMGDVPFRKVLFHGLIRDGQGQKMSKTKGNVVDPIDIVDEYGADALRFTLLSFAGQGRDIKLAADRVEIYRNFATKLWNAARYSEMNNCVFDPAFDPKSVTHTLNKWVIGETGRATDSLSKAIESYRFSDAAQGIYSFVWGTFCDWYLEFTKPILTGQGVDAALVDETRKTTAFVLNQILHLLNPLMPYITEELYAGLSERKPDDRLLTAPWPDAEKFPQDTKARNDVEWLINLINEIRSVRMDMNVPAGAKIRLVVREADGTTQGRLKDFGEILMRLARLESLEDIGSASAPKGAVQVVVGTATYCLPIADIIDLDKERVRLNKEIERLTKEIEKVDQKLGNAEFVANAPAEIIDEQKTRRTDAEAVILKLTQALKQLQAA